jgi:hypothetical protein
MCTESLDTSKSYLPAAYMDNYHEIPNTPHVAIICPERFDRQSSHQEPNLQPNPNLNYLDYSGNNIQK